MVRNCLGFLKKRKRREKMNLKKEWLIFLFLMVAVCLTTVATTVESFAFGRPKANFVHFPWLGAGVHPFKLLAVSTSKGRITSRVWSATDGATGSGIFFFHTFGKGYHEVTLTVTGPGGSDSFTDSFLVGDVWSHFDESATSELPPGCRGPYHDNREYLEGDAPLGVFFFDETLFAKGVDSRSCSYEWDFGDDTGSTGRGPVLEHTYERPGEYHPTLVVTCPGGTSTVWGKSIVAE